MATKAQEAEIVYVLQSHPSGITSDAIWSKVSKVFLDKNELSLSLNDLWKNKEQIFKLTNLWYLEEKLKIKPPLTRPKTMMTVSKPILSVIRKATEEKSTLQKPPNGSLLRSQYKGRVALLLYKNRGNELSFLEIKTRLGLRTASDDSNVSQSLWDLKKKGYITAEYSGNFLRKASYSWSGKFNYPFPSVLPTDIEYLHEVVEEVEEIEAEPDVVQVNDEKEYEVPSFVSALLPELKVNIVPKQSTREYLISTYIDDQIKELEIELASLRRVKEIAIKVYSQS